MGSSIEWTDETLNVVVGCQRVSPGCENCYAEKVAHRGMSPQHKGLTVVGKAGVRWSGEVRLVPEQLEKPLRWRKPRRIFVCSMADLFHPSVPFEVMAAVLGLAVATPRHTYQILTKRPQRMREFFRWVEEQADECAVDVPEYCHLAAIEMLREAPPESAMWAAADDLMDIWTWASHGPYGFEAVDEDDAKDIERRIAKAKRSGADDIDTEAWPLPNVWLGVSVEDQQRADERIPVLLECPAALRFLSCEPLLGPVDLSAWLETPTVTDDDLDVPDGAEIDGLRREGQNFRRVAGIDWVIVGGESGPGARGCEVAWVRSIVDQCTATDVLVFVKQLGARPVVQRLGTSRDQLVVSLKLRSRKGADPSEWPADLRVQELPRIGGAS